MGANHLDTKSQIFNAALRLFAVNGYENVSIRSIADTVGIKTASIYYHYKNKEEILDACYNFYIEHRHSTRLEKEQYEPIIRNGTKKEVLNVLNYSYPDEIVENMILSLLTTFSHMYTDNKAKEIYLDEIDSSMKYLEEFFKMGIEIGRFRAFNIPALSWIFLSSRIFIAQSITLSPERADEWSNIQLDIFDELINIFPFIY